MSLLRAGRRSSLSSTWPCQEAAHHQERRALRTGVLGEGTLACARCDAPISIGPGPVGIAEQLTCPYCEAHGPVREFLSLAAPSRPARVVIRVAIRAARPER